jgi:Flp pilus assembly protein TadD
MEILKKAWTTCPPELVAAAALSLYNAPSANDDQKRQIEIWLVEAVRKRPNAVRLGTDLGVLWIRQGRSEEAESLYRRILGGSPDDPEALNNLAWLLALRHESKAQEALGLIERAINDQGPIPHLVDTRAVACIRDGQIDRAVQDLTQAQRSDPNNPSFARHLAWAYQLKGRSEEAKRLFQKAGELGWKIGNSDPPERAFMERIRKDLGLAAN